MISMHQALLYLGWLRINSVKGVCFVNRLIGESFSTMCPPSNIRIVLAFRAFAVVMESLIIVVCVISGRLPL